MWWGKARALLFTIHSSLNSFLFLCAAALRASAVFRLVRRTVSHCRGVLTQLALPR